MSFKKKRRGKKSVPNLLELIEWENMIMGASQYLDKSFISLLEKSVTMGREETPPIDLLIDLKTVNQCIAQSKCWLLLSTVDDTSLNICVLLIRNTIISGMEEWVDSMVLEYDKELITVFSKYCEKF